MEIKRIGTRPSGKGPANYFTGSVRIDPLNEPAAPARVSMATFEPGARTAWHTTLMGKLLLLPRVPVGYSAIAAPGKIFMRAM